MDPEWRANGESIPARKGSKSSTEVLTPKLYGEIHHIIRDELGKRSRSSSMQSRNSTKAAKSQMSIKNSFGLGYETFAVCPTEESETGYFLGYVLDVPSSEGEALVQLGCLIPREGFQHMAGKAGCQYVFQKATYKSNTNSNNGSVNSNNNFGLQNSRSRGQHYRNEFDVADCFWEAESRLIMIQMERVEIGDEDEKQGRGEEKHWMNGNENENANGMNIVEKQGVPRKQMHGVEYPVFQLQQNIKLLIMMDENFDDVYIPTTPERERALSETLYNINMYRINQKNELVTVKLDTSTQILDMCTILYETLLQKASDINGWKLEENEGGIKMYTRSRSIPGFLHVLAQAKVPASSCEIYLKLLAPKNRKHFEPLYKEVEVLQTIDDNTSVVRLIDSPIDLFDMLSREFIVLTHGRSRDEKCYTISANSIELINSFSNMEKPLSLFSSMTSSPTPYASLSPSTPLSMASPSSSSINHSHFHNSVLGNPNSSSSSSSSSLISLSGNTTSISGSSVSTLASSSSSSYSRGKLLESGWVIEQVGKGESIVSYIILMDIGGWLPNFVYKSNTYSMMKEALNNVILYFLHSS